MPARTRRFALLMDIAMDAGPARPLAEVELVLATSAFCGACAATRQVVAEAVRLVPSVRLTEIDVVRDEPIAERLGVRTTPTLLVRNESGDEVFRAAGVPTVDQVLAAVALAV